jgi:RHS repeat-associated protein
MARGGKRYSYLVDGQGSTIALADEAGNVSERYSYDAFGNPTTSGQVPNPFLYTGQMWEPEAGLYYDRARFYEPESGRFISRDPRRSLNPYLYVEGNPPNLTDPTGEFADVAEPLIVEQDAEILDATEVQSAASLESDVERIAEKVAVGTAEAQAALEAGTPSFGQVMNMLAEALPDRYVFIATSIGFTVAGVGILGYLGYEGISELIESHTGHH